MKRDLAIEVGGVTDTTGYLHTLAKSLAIALHNSPYRELSGDIVATSGFAFRIWAHKELCPSAMSVWEFKQQAQWVENIGLKCGYAERLWGQDDLEEARRREALALIRASIENGIPAIAWDTGDAEWGLVTGYDDEAQIVNALQCHGNPETAAVTIPMERLGKLEIPILSVLTVTGYTPREPKAVLADTLNMAAGHLRGEEWCENAAGLAAYAAIIKFVEEDLTGDCWELEYYLGNYAALRYCAWRYLESAGAAELAELYRQSHQALQAAFEAKRSGDISDSKRKAGIAENLKTAFGCEEKALKLM